MLELGFGEKPGYFQAGKIIKVSDPPAPPPRFSFCRQSCSSTKLDQVGRKNTEGLDMQEYMHKVRFVLPKEASRM